MTLAARALTAVVHRPREEVGGDSAPAL